MGNANNGTYANCVINVWTGPPDVPSLEELGELCRTVADDNGGSLILMAVLEEGAPFVDASQRKALELFYSSLAGSFGAVAQVVEGTSLWSVTARSVMTAMRLVQRRGYPLRVFSNAEEAVEWLAANVANAESAAEAAAGLRAKLQSMRKEHRAAS